MSPPESSSEAGPRHGDWPTAENTPPPTSLRRPGDKRGATHCPDSALSASRKVVEPARVRGEHEVAALACWPAGDAELLESAAAHVQRVRERCPWARAIDPAVHHAIVVAWLQPLPADRPFRRPAAPWQRGDAVWVGGAVGLHVPRAREAS